MHTYLKTEFLYAFSILKSMGFICFFFFSYICMSVLYFETGDWSRVSLWPCAWQSSCFNLLSVELYLCWFLVCLCFGSLGWPWTHYLAKDDLERSSCPLFGLHMACAILPDVFLYLGLFKIFPRTATNPQVQYFLDWEAVLVCFLKAYALLPSWSAKL